MPVLSKDRRHRRMTAVRIPGKKSGRIMLYTLSTCDWCEKVKKLLDDLGVEYDYEYVDLLSGDEREKTMKTVEKWNPACSFPTLVINNSRSIAGFREDQIREALKL